MATGRLTAHRAAVSTAPARRLNHWYRQICGTPQIVWTAFGMPNLICRLGRAVAIALMPLSGCSLWYQPPGEPSELPALPPSASSTTLEILFVHLPADLEDPEALWQDVDEQNIAPEFRQRLAENGIRCGVTGAQLPPALQALMQAPSDGSPSSETFHTVSVRRIPLPPGQSREIMTSSIRPEMIVLYNDGRSTEGDIREQAQGALRIRGHSDGSRQAALTLIPEIHYGPARSHYEPRQGALQMTVRRDIQAFERLAVETSLAYGQHLLITCVDPPKGLGANLFAETADQQSYRQLLVIRLASLPVAELFPSTAPLGPVADGWD